MKRITILLLALTAFLAGQAQWPTNPNLNQPLNFLPSPQAAPVGVTDGNNGAIVFWEDLRNGNSDIYAQRVNNNGGLEWPLTGVPVCLAAGHQTNIRAIADGFGGAFLVWEDERSGDRDLYAQRIDAGGNALWAANGIAITIFPRDQFDARCVIDPAGFIFLSWTDTRGGAGESDIYGQKLDFNGNKFWFLSGQPICKLPGLQYGPFVQPDGVGGAIYNWVDERSGNPVLYADRMLPNGFSMWNLTGKPIANQTNVLKTGSLKSGNDILIPYLSGSFANSQLRLQRLDLSGNLLEGNPGLAISSAALTVKDEMFDFATDGRGGLNAIWADSRNGNSDLYVGRYRINGTLVGPAGGTQLTFLPGNETHPSLSDPNCNGASIAVWEDSRNASTDLFAQRVDTTLIGLWAPNGLPLSTAGNSQDLSEHSVVNTDAGIIGYWSDFRTDLNGDIYAQAMDCDGNLSVNLPVNLSFFDGELQGEEVLLTWETGSELNNDYFQIERSADGQNYEILGYVPAGGQSGRGASYQLVDISPLQGDNFYRLRQVDLDGSFTYGKTVLVAISSQLSLSIYPNPTSDFVRISGLSSGDAPDHTYQIISFSGKVLQHGQLASSQQISLSNLPSGMYVMQVSNPQGQQVFAGRLVKND